MYMEKNNIQFDNSEPEGTLLLRYVRGEVSTEEKLRVDTWLEADATRERILLQTARIYHADRRRQRMAGRDPLAAYEKVSVRLQKRIRFARLRKASLIAACIACIFGCSALLSYLQEKSASRHPRWVTLEANAGTRTHFNLPDGTLVYLNAGSTLSYPQPFDPEERKVILAGEAYFEVTRQTQQSFIVGIADGRYKVNVMGTTFTIRAYPDTRLISTTLVEGSVRLEVKHPDGKAYRQMMVPSEKAVYDLSNGKMRLERVDPAVETAWIEGKLIFKDTPLPEVLRNLSHYYNVDFTVQDTTLAQDCITGILDNRPLSQALDYLKLSSNVDFRIDEVKTDDSRHISRPRVTLWKKK